MDQIQSPTEASGRFSSVKSEHKLNEPLGTCADGREKDLLNEWRPGKKDAKQLKR